MFPILYNMFTRSQSVTVCNVIRSDGQTFHGHCRYTIRVCFPCMDQSYVDGSQTAHRHTVHDTLMTLRANAYGPIRQEDRQANGTRYAYDLPVYVIRVSMST